MDKVDKILLAKRNGAALNCKKIAIAATVLH
jgi:hypothetical protein